MLVDSVYEHVIAWGTTFQQKGIDVQGRMAHRYIGISGKLLVRGIFRVPIFVAGSVVLNQDGSPAAVASGQLVEEAKVGGGIKHLLLAVVERRAPQFDRAENLHGLACTGDGNLRGTTHAAPGSVQCRVLSETWLRR